MTAGHATVGYPCVARAETAPDTGSYEIVRDPIEKDPRYAEVFKNIRGEVDELLKDHPMRNHIGFVHVFWATEKRLLKEKYGIDWKSLAEMNPYVLFD